MAAQFNDAHLLIVLPPWRLEVTLNLAITVLVAGFLLFYGTLRGIALTLALPGRVSAYRPERRRRAKAAAVFQEAVPVWFSRALRSRLKKAAEAHAAASARSGIDRGPRRATAARTRQGKPGSTGRRWTTPARSGTPDAGGGDASRCAPLRKRRLRCSRGCSRLPAVISLHCV